MFAKKKNINRRKLQFSAIIFLISAFIISSVFFLPGNIRDFVLALTGDYSKDSGDPIYESDWNNLDDDFVDVSGDTMTGDLYVQAPTGSAEVRIDALTDGQQAGLLFTEQGFSNSRGFRFYYDSYDFRVDRYGGGSAQNVMFIERDNGNVVFYENVGIGTTSPYNELEVAGEARITSPLSDTWSKVLKIYAPDINEGENAQISFGFKEDARNAAELNFTYSGPSSTDNKFGIGFNSVVDVISLKANRDVAINTNDLFISGSSGNVGIGTASPVGQLDVAGSICFSGDCRSDWATTGGVWSQAGSDIYYNDGNVGIGTNSPQAKLHVYDGDILIGVDRQIRGDLAWGPYIKLGTLNGDGYQVVLANTYSNASFPSYGAVVFKTKGVEKMRIVQSGNVGIGTDSPSHELVVKDSSGSSGIYVWGDSQNAELALGDGASHWAIYSDEVDTDDLRFWRGSTNHMVITDSGNVGIGTTNPLKKLHISDGTIRVEKSINYTTINTDKQLIIQNSNSTADNYATIAFSDADNNDIAAIGAKITNHTLNNAELRFGTASGSGVVERMTIDKDGNVGIGTTAPSQKLEIQGAGAAIQIDDTAEDAACRLRAFRDGCDSGWVPVANEGVIYICADCSGSDW